MAVIAGLLGMLAATGGLQLAFVLDTPAGPSIVCLAAGLFAASSLAGLLLQRRRS
ncbi:metal ABC transporter permease [Leisingera sp. JC1]